MITIEENGIGGFGSHGEHAPVALSKAVGDVHAGPYGIVWQSLKECAAVTHYSFTTLYHEQAPR